MKDDFTVSNPSKENIDYAFKNLIYYVNASIELDEYKEYKNKFEKVLTNIKKVLHIYVNKNDICLVDNNTLQEIKYDLIDLQVSTQSLNSYFAEWALQWIEAIISLKEVKDNG